jgi:hypothetical protein
LRAMPKRVLMFLKILFIFFPAFVAFASPEVDPANRPAREVLIHEGFASLESWRTFQFPGIERQTMYIANSEERFLKTESSASASALIHKKEFNVYKYPRIRWRWKIHNVYRSGDPGKKSGDDYPIRVYIMFKYDASRAGPLDRVKHGLAALRYGENPPFSALNYVWASKNGQETISTSPYTDMVKIIALKKGADGAGVWHEEEVDVLRDYRRAFGTEPPAMAAIAVMNDSDNTKESSVSYVGAIEVFRYAW